MTKKGNLQKTEVNTLYFYANKYKQAITAEEELENIDMTEILLHELETMISEGELINININGRVRTGKSTLAFALALIIFNLLKKYKQIEEERKFGLKNIARDQQEYDKLMQNPETRFTVIAVDEDNKAERTGENSSTIKAIEETISDVHAARYVHKIQCSPKDTTDDNSDILLSVIGVNKHERTTHAKLYYRFYEGMTEHIQLLGYIKICVDDIIKIWDKKVKKHYYKPKRNRNDELTIEKHKKNDWYTQYIVKKHEKMDLMVKEGISRPRELNYARIILETIEQLKKLTILSRLVDHNIVRNMIKSKSREEKLPLSIVGEELSTREALGTLKLYETLNNLNTKLESKKRAKKIAITSGKGTTEQINKTKEEIKQIEEIIKEVRKSISRQLNEYGRYKEIKEKYDKK